MSYSPACSSSIRSHNPLSCTSLGASSTISSNSVTISTPLGAKGTLVPTSALLSSLVVVVGGVSAVSCCWCCSCDTERLPRVCARGGWFSGVVAPFFARERFGPLNGAPEIELGPERRGEAGAVESGCWLLLVAISSAVGLLPPKQW
jgi:hypothetical protein